MAIETESNTGVAVWRVAARSVLATPEDYAVCRRIMQAASRNYSFASRFFPAEKLPHVEALYALMRIGDDRVDVAHTGFASPRAAIDDWEHSYWRAFERGDSPEPVLRAYLDTALKFGIPADVMTPYFRAMRDDLTIKRFETFADLCHYMDGSALPVGRGMTYILGVRPPARLEDALPGADSLSMAMQLSNFWRDIREDLIRSDRVYIPQEDLARFGVREVDLMKGRVTERFVALMEFEIQRTESYYEEATQAVRLLASGQWAVMSGLEVYRAILTGIRRNGYDVFRRRAAASKWGKAGLALRAALQVGFSRPA